MTLLQLLAAAAGTPADALRAIIHAGIAASPDLAPLLEGFLSKLDEAVTPESIGNLALSLTPELTEIFKGHFDGRSRPSDLA